jgi:hypothetical protein
VARILETLGPAVKSLFTVRAKKTKKPLKSTT